MAKTSYELMQEQLGVVPTKSYTLVPGERPITGVSATKEGKPVFVRGAPLGPEQVKRDMQAFQAMQLNLAAVKAKYDMASVQTELLVKAMSARVVPSVSNKSPAAQFGFFGGAQLRSQPQLKVLSREEQEIAELLARMSPEERRRMLEKAKQAPRR